MFIVKANQNIFLIQRRVQLVKKGYQLRILKSRYANLKF